MNIFKLLRKVLEGKIAQFKTEEAKYYELQAINNKLARLEQQGIKVLDSKGNQWHAPKTKKNGKRA